MSLFNFEKYLSIKIWFLRIIFCFRNIKNKNFILLILVLYGISRRMVSVVFFCVWLILIIRVVIRVEIKIIVRYFVLVGRKRKVIYEKIF